jgi:polysaccharide export outer membrane protein
VAVLQPGDQVHLAVWKHPEMSGEFLVAADGTLAHPLFRDTHIAGISQVEAEALVRTVLQRYETDPQFVYQPLVRVAVVGAVRTPNLLSVPPSTTIAEAIALAGGPSDDARVDHVRVLRAGGALKLSAADLAARNWRVASGDEIVVARRSTVFRDFIAPSASIAAAFAAVATLLRR